MNKDIKQSLFIVVTIIATAIVVKRCNPQPKEKGSFNSKIQQIETRLQPIIQRAEIHETKAIDGKNILNGLSSRFDSLSKLIDRSKDTVYILSLCDSIRQDYANYRLNATSVIAHLDSAIIDYKTVIQGKDTIIELQIDQIAQYQKSNKKLKLQRNLSLILNAVLAGLVIIK